VNNQAPPFVSVIVPVYNDQPGIDLCVSALSTQSYPADRFEILIVDNDSAPPIHVQDVTASSIRLLCCSEAGSYAARNMGIRESRGEILAFTDADCIPQPNWIEAGVAALHTDGNGCIVGGNVQFTATDTQRATELYQRLGGFPQESNISDRGFAATANFFGHRNNFDRVGMFNTELLSGGDLDWCLRASQHDIKAVFSATTIVMTSPRADLRSAIRQARRVAGGRFAMRRSTLATFAGERIRPHRRSFAAIAWILSQRQLSLITRLRLLFVASLIKAAQAAETLRLRLGGSPERR